MTRKKKTRRTGSEGPAQYVDKNQTEQDRIARMLKKQKKRKGKKQDRVILKKVMCKRIVAAARKTHGLVVKNRFHWGLKLRNRNNPR